MINKTKYLIFLLFLLVNCSFDNKTGIWDGSEKEKERISGIEKEQRKIKKVVKIYTSTEEFSEEISSSQRIILAKPEKISSWTMSSLNFQNSLGSTDIL